MAKVIGTAIFAVVSVFVVYAMAFHVIVDLPTLSVLFPAIAL